MSGELEIEFNRKARSRNAFARGVPAYPPFTLAPATERLSRKAKKRANSTAEHYVMETDCAADLAIVKAWKGDTAGNLIYRKTARNFNPMMATAAEGNGRRSRTTRAARRT